MAGRVVHSKVSGKPNPTDTTKIGGADWDADHTITGLTIGSDIQAHSANLDALASVVPGVNKVPYFTGAGTADVADLAVIAAAAPFDALSSNGLQVNGSFEVDQEHCGNSVSFGAGTVESYVVDFFRVYKSGTMQLTAQQTASVFRGYKKELKVTITTAQASIGSDSLGIKSFISGRRFSRLKWGTADALPVTIGFWAKSSVSGTVAVTIANSASSSSVSGSVSIASAGVPQWCTVTLAGVTSGTWLDDDGIGAQLLVVLAAGGGNINRAATNGNTFEIAGLVVLPNSVAPPSLYSSLIMRPYDEELLRCQWLYRKTFPVDTAVATGSGYVGSIMYQARTAAANPWFHWHIFGTMRAAPTVTFYNPVSANNKWYNATNAADSGAATPYYISNQQLVLGNAQVAGDAVSNLIAIHATFDSRW